MNWMGLFLFALVCIAVGMALMDIIATKGRYEATTEAYNIGYAKGVEAEKERIGRLLDKYLENLERGKSSDSERVFATDSVSRQQD